MPTPIEPITRRETVSRRDFLHATGTAAAGLLLAGCQTPAAPTVVPTPVPTAAPKPRVAIARALDYDRATIENQVAAMIDQVGGLGDVVKPGDSVAIKVNLTGGITSGTLNGLKPEDTYVTHPEVARALVRQVQAAGAKEVFIVEAVYEWESYTVWGYEDLAAETGAILIDLNDSKPFGDFIEAPVGGLPGLIYQKFTLNKLVTDVDVFMSISKMKNHYLAGVTHTMKNLYGLVPYRFYRLSEEDRYRSGFHGVEDETRARLPRIIVDINRARPINFGLVDGVLSTQGGEGPWISTLAAIQPGLLVAGKNPVATDAVATALMGHDPTGEYPDAPYFRTDNHLNLAAAAGLGTNRLDEIDVVGAVIDDVKVQFSGAV